MLDNSDVRQDIALTSHKDLVEEAWRSLNGLLDTGADFDEFLDSERDYSQKLLNYWHGKLRLFSHLAGVTSALDLKQLIGKPIPIGGESIILGSINLSTSTVEMEATADKSKDKVRLAISDSRENGPTNMVSIQTGIGVPSKLVIGRYPIEYDIHMNDGRMWWFRRREFFEQGRKGVTREQSLEQFRRDANA